ncbi:DM13 domain-containing protein [Trujillonella humicola]|uniref:DM13 domain-containing protein n=1 Tax=Trujillonella humicola TaxID=3383699 RepID=UPI0039069DD1
MLRGSPLLRKLAVVLGVAAVAALALWLLPISPAALVPRTVTSWLIVAAIVVAILLWSRLLVPRVTRRPWVRGVLRAVPVLALVAVVLVPATVDREVNESLLEGIPVPTETAGGAPGEGAAGGQVGGGTAPGAPPAGEPAPGAPPAGEPAPSSTPPPAPAEPERISSGEIEGVGHTATGEAVVYRSGDTYFVRLEDIDIQGAVDVFVWLVPGAGQEEPDDGVNLGGLKGTSGSANYVVPADVDVGQYRTVLLWCRAFSTPIAVAVQA